MNFTENGKKRQEGRRSVWEIEKLNVDIVGLTDAKRKGVNVFGQTRFA